MEVDLTHMRASSSKEVAAGAHVVPETYLLHNGNAAKPLGHKWSGTEEWKASESTLPIDGSLKNQIPHLGSVFQRHTV